jgi:predicted NUDIX family NTP pyrophosphohydrolase
LVSKHMPPPYNYLYHTNFTMPKQSAGILAYRKIEVLEVFLVHPGGPFFTKKDEGVWTIPKGEFDENEEALTAAKREFFEETGFKLSGEFIELRPIKQKAGKVVYAWAIETDIKHAEIRSNTFSIEWPPKSGKMREFAEVDRAEWFTIDVAKVKINAAQIDLIDQLTEKINTD